MSPAQAVTAVIAAAGSGERLGAGGPKAFVPLAGRPMIAWSLDACLACEGVAGVVVAVPTGHEHGLEGIERVRTVDGGSTRAESVANALAAVDTAYVAIHDAARPLLTAELLADLIAARVADAEAAGIIAAAPLTDTVKEVEGDRIAETLDRSILWGAQTPQVFRTELLRAALDTRGDATDEATLVEAAGGTVRLHEPGGPNLKVTTRLDLRLAELVLADRDR